MYIAFSIAVFTVALIMVRPKPLNEGMAAAVGACLMLASQQVLFTDLFSILRYVAPILLFFLGLMLICLSAEKAGFFGWSAYQAVNLAKGKGQLLFFTIFALGVAITAFFSNDTTALVLTPIVFTLARELKLRPLPYVFSCAFIANTASLLLPISNPVNLLPFTAFGLSLGEYLRYLMLPSLAGIGMNVLVFYLLFRSDISSSFSANMCPQPKDAFFKYVSVALGFIAVAYLVTAYKGLPLFWVALGGGLLLVVGGLILHRLHSGEIASGISWSILLFIFSLSVVVKGLEKSGFIAMLGNVLAHSFPQQQSFISIAGVALSNALGSNLINNWSMIMVSTAILSVSNPSPDPSLIYAAILGADLGPNLTIVGSLSSMLWLVILRQRGLDLSPGQYFKVGLILTPPLLAITIGCLYLMSRIA